MKLGSEFRIADFGLRIEVVHGGCCLHSLACGAHAVDLRVATFKVDVTPPPGSPLCDGLGAASDWA